MVESTKTMKKKAKKPQHIALSNKSVSLAAVKKSKFPYMFTTDKKRANALECHIGSFDPVINYMVRNAENHFIPKQVYTKNDWLACKVEPG